MPAFIHLQANGNNLPGGSNVYSALAGIELSDYTQIISFYQDTARPWRSSQHQTAIAGRTEVSPFTIVKNTDTITPLLLDAMLQNKSINAHIKFFDQGGLEGSAREAYRITLMNAQIVSVRTELQYTTPSDHSMPLERVSIQPAQFNQESPLGNSTVQWNWDTQA